MLSLRLSSRLEECTTWWQRWDQVHRSHVGVRSGMVRGVGVGSKGQGVCSGMGEGVGNSSGGRRVARRCHVWGSKWYGGG